MQQRLDQSQVYDFRPPWLRSAKEQFLRDGFAVVPSIWSSEEIKPAIDALSAITASDATANLQAGNDNILRQSDVRDSQLVGIPLDTLAQAAEQVYIVGDIAAQSQALKDMILDRRCSDIAACLLDNDVVCHFSNATIRAARVGCSCNWHRDWPNSYCTTRTGRQLRIMICLDGMQNGQGVTRVIPGSYAWTNEMFSAWRTEFSPINTTGVALVCPPGSMVILGPTVVHGAELNLSQTPRRNLIAQWGAKSEIICMETFESITGLTA